MSVEKNKAIVKRYFEQVWGEQRPDRLAEYWEEDFVYHDGPANMDGLKTGLLAFLNAFDDLRFTKDLLIAEGDKVVVRWTIAATHQGAFMGVPATGKHIKYSGMTIFRLSNGKFVEVWVSADNLVLMQQLGALPIPETS